MEMVVGSNTATSSPSARERQKSTGRFSHEPKGSNSSFPIVHQHKTKPKSFSLSGLWCLDLDIIILILQAS